MPLVGALVAAILVGGIAPAASAATPAAPSPDFVAFGKALAAAVADADKPKAGSSRSEVTVTLPNGKQAKAYRIAIPDSPSGIAVLWDRYTGAAGGHTLPVGSEGAEAEKAEAFVRRVEAAVGELASSTEGRQLLEGIGRMRPIDVVTGSAKPAFGHDAVTTLFYRGMPADETQWPDALKKRLKEAEEADKALADDLRQNAVVSEPVANAIDRGRANNSNGSEGMVAMPDEEKVFFGYLPDRTPIAIHETQLIGHELVHVSHYLQGTLLDGPRWNVEVEVRFKAADGSERSATVVIPGEEVRTNGGDDALKYVTVASKSGASTQLKMAPVEASDQAIVKAIAQAPNEAVKKALQDVQTGRYQTYPSSETRLADENGWRARPHYALPEEEMAKAWGKPRAEVAGEFVAVPPGETIAARDLKDPQALRRRLEKAGEKTGKKVLSSAVQACSRFFGRRQPVVCSADGRPEEVTQETRSRVEEVRRVRQEHPETPLRLPVADHDPAVGAITRKVVEKLEGFHGVKAGDVDSVLDGIERHGSAGNDDPNWKAFYLGESESHAAGYSVSEEGMRMSAGGVVKVDLPGPLTVATVDMAKQQGETDEQFERRRLQRIKDEFGVGADAPLMDSLAEKKTVLKMKDGTTDNLGAERYELIVPWEMVKGNKPELVKKFSPGRKGYVEAEEMMYSCSLPKLLASTAPAKGLGGKCTELAFVKQSAEALDTLEREKNVAASAKAAAEAAGALENSADVSAEVRQKAKAAREKLEAAVSEGKVDGGKLAEARTALTSLAEALGDSGKPVAALGKTLDSTAGREPARAEAIEAGKKWQGRARERAKELCAKSGTASCLETVDWDKLRTEIRSDAEQLVKKKLAGAGGVSEIKLSKDLGTSLKDPAVFYVPYEKTRTQLAGKNGELAWERVKTAGGAVLYLHGIYSAFAEDSTDLDKAAAIAAIIPGVGDILNLAVDVEHKDFAGLGVDAAATLAGFLEMAGVEGIGGPAFAVAMAYHITSQLITDDFHRWEDVAKAPERRDADWHKALMDYLQDPDKGWLSKEGGTQVVAMAVSFLQAVEFQRASVKATANAATVSTDSGAYPVPKTGDGAGTEASKDADAAVDALTAKTPDIVRHAAAKTIADSMNAAWKEEKGQQFNKAYIDRVNGINLGIWCGRSMPDGSNPCHDDAVAMKKEALEKLSKAPPGVTVQEVEDVLENFGLTDPGFLTIGKPFRLYNESDIGKQYLHFDVEGGTATRKQRINDSSRQEFFFRSTGRITNLEGVLCLAGGKNKGDPVSVTPCTHKNAPEQRWLPDGKGRIKNFATGQYLDVGGPSGDVTTWTADGDARRQTWKAETPERRMYPQTSKRAIEELLDANGSSKQIDGAIPDAAEDGAYWLFSGSNMRRVLVRRVDWETEILASDSDPVRKTVEQWSGLGSLFTASRDSRITAGMRVPGHPGELYVFSGEHWARIKVDRDDKGNESVRLVSGPKSLDEWQSLKGLFTKSGSKRIDAVRPIPGVADCFQMFSGTYSNQICLNNELTDRETASVQRNAERWPEIGAYTGKDEVQGFVQNPDRPMENFVFTGGQYTKVDRSVLHSPPDANLGIHATWAYFTFSWKNGKGLPEGTKIEISRSGVTTASGAYDASLGEILPDDGTRKSLLFNFPRDLVGAWDSTMRARFTYTHPDGSQEATGYWEKKYWCSFWECNFR
ncbi:ricin-type beta-trefoil lectin domain protein [Streptomyces sp. NPDC001404]|uniref:ricin-type beta-trefoil lectin domain protein n=1 Tax=Streptomyces sp. NPDC001404 TaxID=3364571 RepID=UPI003681BA79